jgi:hypothetical protein
MRMLSSRAGEGDENENIPRKAVQYYAPGNYEYDKAHI